MNIQEIKLKYLGDSEFTKERNRVSHLRKQKGIKLDKNTKVGKDLRAYISNVNKILPRQVQVYEKNNYGDTLPTFGVNWAAIGTVSVPEAKLFAQKILKACEMIQNAPKPAPDVNVY